MKFGPGEDLNLQFPTWGRYAEEICMTLWAAYHPRPIMQATLHSAPCSVFCQSLIPRLRFSGQLKLRAKITAGANFARLDHCQYSTL